jgi:hypothetical protein
MVDGKMMSFVEKRLDKVTLPKSFDGVLVIPQEVTQIGRYACKGLNQFKEVVLPDNLVIFGIEAFADCENLEKISFPATLRSLAESCFANCTSLAELYIPATLRFLAKHLYDLPANTKIIIDEAHPYYKIEDGAILSKDGTIFKLLRDDDVEDYEVKEGVKVIEEGAFNGRKNLKKVTLPTSIVEVESAFSGCPNLTTIVIKSEADVNVRTAFDGCISPKEAGIFSNPTILKAIYVPAKKIGYYKDKEHVWQEYIRDIIMELPADNK